METGATRDATLARLDDIDDLFKPSSGNMESVCRALSNLDIDEVVSERMDSAASSVEAEHWLRPRSCSEIAKALPKSYFDDDFQSYPLADQSSSEAVPDDEIDLDDVPDLTDTSASSTLLAAENLVLPGNTESHHPEPDLFPDAPRWFICCNPIPIRSATMSNIARTQNEPTGSMSSGSVTTRSLVDSNQTTSDSESAFESDQSSHDRSPGQAELLLAIHMLRNYILSRYPTTSTKTAHGGESAGGDHGPSTQQSTGGSQMVQRASSKRKHSKQANGGNGDDDKRKKGSRATRSSSSSKGSDDLRLFACPFYKRRPHTYQKCQHNELTAVSRVKQHLSRQHQIPIRCLRCNLQFEDEGSLEDHAQQWPSCEPQPRKVWEGVTRAQSILLQTRSDRKKTPEDQWYDVYKILFPDEPLPESPYMDSIQAQMLQGFYDYARETFPSTYDAAIEQDIPEQYREQWHAVRPYVVSAMPRTLEMLFSLYANQVFSSSRTGTEDGNQILEGVLAPVFAERNAITNARQPEHDGFVVDAGNSSLIQDNVEILRGPVPDLLEFFPVYSMEVANHPLATGLVNEFERMPSQTAADGFPSWLGCYLQERLIESLREG